MTLIPRPASPGDRLTWRARRAPLVVVPPAPPIDRADADRLDVELERRAGVRRALDRLTATGTTPAYRQARALLALQVSVEAQARIAGLGRHTDKPWRTR